MKDFVRKNTINNVEFDFICDFIKLRHELGLTQKEMAQKCGELRTHIAKIEAGIASPNLRSIANILEPLGYKLSITKIDSDK